VYKKFKVLFLVWLACPTILWSKYDPCAFAQKTLPCEHGRVSHLMFSPDDPVERMLCSLIANETERIELMQFMVTNKNISQSLAKRVAAGVPVELIIDGGNVDCPFSKIPFLKDAGIEVHVHERIQTPFYKKLMHEKVIIFHNNTVMPGGITLVLFGSCNLTSSACRYNKEDLYITNDAKIWQQFCKRFGDLKRLVYGQSQ
jgi:phosphatidylserine/phosphatidylglycerophosphate/cardiolipin synthase-like enzyme